ncbi:caspase family protein [Flavisolibacter ginsenosidimutans]|uniref:Caspase family protein n=1 Tax=Flavisolibacter ginsenosidimutans TaxID=661481 RepID=A0A5B8UEK6_9BACT|nr:caspase family protein [Flavisolibacter ginsenosidimutans]QEC54795.1 caspase family protein [Flavisolibacter ginsenosidimutans]
MRKVSKLFFFLSLCCSLKATAQNQYALLVGINDYYQSRGVKHPKSLHGCVNDASSMRELLLNRFGYRSANIDTLYNASATKPNLLSELHQLLGKCRPGDAFVFYYSGHGIWLNNYNEPDSIKMRRSQAMVMSDLYSPGFDCLVTDENLKKEMNKFIDKRVKVTAIFDCCHSGNISMGGGNSQPSYWSPYEVESWQMKSLQVGDIAYVPKRKQPIGCPADFSTNSRFWVDSDNDGVPDCKDWEIHSPRGVPVDSLGVATSSVNPEDYLFENSEIENDSLDSGASADNSRSYNLKDTFSINYRVLETRPSDRKGGGFFSLSASDQDLTAAEITDESGLPHGAFTTALLAVYKENPSNLRMTDLMAKLTDWIRSKSYIQTPKFHFDKERLNSNLLGFDNANFSNTVVTHCIAAANGTIVFDKGLYAAITKGDILKKVDKNESITVQVVSATKDAATAVDKTGAVKRGDIFQFVGTATVPPVKLYIPEASFTQAGFQGFFQNKIYPLTLKKDYGDYGYAVGDANNASFYSGTQKRENSVRLYSSAQRFVVYEARIKKEYNDPYNPVLINRVVLLPLPSYIIQPLKKMVSGNPNIKLVNRPEEADYVLYLNYANVSLGTSKGFIFYYHPPLNNKNVNATVFSADNVTVSTLSFAGTQLQSFCEKLYVLTKSITVYHKYVWLYGKKK